VKLVSLCESVVSRVAFFLAGASLLLIVALVFAEIVARNVFESSTYMSIEVSGYLIAVFTLCGLCVCILENQVLRVNLITAQLRGPVARAVFWAVKMAVAIGVLGGSAYFFLLSAMRSYARNYSSGSYIDLPIWIPEAFVVGGFVLCLAAAIVSAPRQTEEEAVEHV